MKTAAETDRQRWERLTLEPALRKSPERVATFTTISGRPVERLYTAADVPAPPPDAGVYPYTRGIHASGYRRKLWTMRQFDGFGTPEQTNERYKTLLQAGGTDQSLEINLPTLRGRDPNHVLAR